MNTALFAAASSRPMPAMLPLLLAVNCLMACVLIFRVINQRATRSGEVWFAVAAGVGALAALVGMLIRPLEGLGSLSSVLSILLAIVSGSHLFSGSSGQGANLNPIPAPGSDKKPVASLSEDAEGARLLISYLVRNGLIAEKDGPKQIGKDTLASAIEDLHKVEKSLVQSAVPPAISEEDEALFYERYGKLATAAQPVTVPSLRDSLPPPGQSLSKADVRIREQWVFLLTSVILLVLVQAYASLGVMLSSTVEKTYASWIGTYSQDPRATNATDVVRLAIPDKIRLDLDKLQSADATLKAWVGPFIRGLGAVGFYYEDVPLPPSPVAASDGALPVPKLPDRFEQTRLQATMVLAFLQTYLLPCLYGWAGAMVYIIRRLTQEANERTFRNGALHFGTRAWLGIVAGLAIGWFSAPAINATAPGSAAVVNTLGPLPLAFLAGYAVEIFFSVLDRFVRAFTAEPPPSGPNPAR